MPRMTGRLTTGVAGGATGGWARCHACLRRRRHEPASSRTLEPRGTSWDDEHVERLVRRYPGLAARFR